MDIKTALNQLDPLDDEQWTTDGAPRVDAVAKILGTEVTRKQITDAAPDLTRDKVAESTTAKESDAPATDDDVDELEAELAQDGEPSPPIESEGQVEHVAEFDAGYVEPADNVVGMDPRVVCQDVELIDRALAEFERQAVILDQRREACLKKLKDLGQRSALLNKYRARLAGPAGRGNPRAIQDYLAAGQRARAERAARARRFIDAGTTADDVAKQLSSKAPIDQAMGKRKAPPTAQRPAYPRTVPG